MILLSIGGFELAFIAFFPQIFLKPAFAGAGSISLAIWICSAAIVAVFVACVVKSIPGLGQALRRGSLDKILALWIAIPSGILEEVVFRRMLMNQLASEHFALVFQCLISAAAFGLAHAAWGFGKGKHFGTAVTSTAGLGLGLASLYCLDGRILLPCVIAHFSVNLILEPHLLEAYFRRLPARS